MNRLICVFMLFLTGTRSFCFEFIQPSPLETARSTDSVHVTRLLSQIELLKASQPDSALLLNSLAVTLATSVNNRGLMLEVLLDRAKLFLATSRTDSADLTISRADTIWQEMLALNEQNKNLEYDLYNVQGSSKQQRRELSEALQYFLKGKSIAEELQDPVLICKQNYNIGICYLGSGSFPEAVDRLSEVIDCAKNIDDALLQAKAYNTTGLSYYFMNSLESAEVALNLAHELALSNGLTILRYQSLANLANVYLDQNRLEKAAATMQNSIAAATELGDNYTVAANYVNLIRLEFRQSKIANAKRHLRTLQEILQKSEFPEIRMQNANFKAILAFFEKDFDLGYQLYSDALSLRDSIKSSESQTQIAQLELEYETVKKDNEIQSQQLTIVKKDRERNNLLFLISLLGISIISILMLFRQSKKRRLAELELKQQQIMDLEQKNKILGLAAIIEGQESERSRIAKDLHDGLGVLLSSVRRQVQKVQSEIKKLTEIDLISDTEKLVATACEEVRRISHDMMPDALMNFGIKEAVMDMAAQIRSDHNILVELDIRDDLKLTDLQSINLYRIIQEFSNNTLKHSDASKIEIKIDQYSQNIVLLLRDDGEGFDPFEAKKTGGLGLSNIESRVDLLKGELDFNMNHGTQFQITIPNS